MNEPREPKVPINTRITAKEYEVVKNRAEVFHCHRADVVRYALYLGLKQLLPQYKLSRPPEADIFESDNY